MKFNVDVIIFINIRKCRRDLVKVKRQFKPNYKYEGYFKKIIK